MKAGNWRSEVDSLVEKGRLADALVFMELQCEKLDDQPVDERLDKLSKLIDVCYSQLNHKKASGYASDLLGRLGMSGHVSWLFGLTLSVLVCISYMFCGRVPGALLLIISKKYSLPSQPSVRWHHLRSILYGRFWQNIRECVHYPLMQLLVSETSEHKSLSIGMLGYSLSYAGYGVVGNGALQRVINDSFKVGKSDVAIQLLPHIVIGYGMAADVDRAKKAHEMMREKGLPPFYEYVTAANTISLSIADENLLVAQASIEQCFMQSFSLASSANHVQVYGGQAVLFALLSKRDEAVSLMKKSKDSATIGSSPLNWLYFYRLEALMWYALGDAEECSKSLDFALKYCEEYGRPKWHVLELRRIFLANLSLEDKGYCFGKFLFFRFLLSSLVLLNKGLLGKGLGILRKTLFERGFVYWSNSEKIEFYKKHLEDTDKGSASSPGKISLSIASAFMASYKDFAEPSVLTVELLREQIKDSLPVVDVVCLLGREAVLRYIENSYGNEGVVLINENTDKIKVNCKNEGFFIFVSAPKVDIGLHHELGGLFVGVLIPHVDVQSEDVIEAFLRVMVSQYVFSRSLLALEESKRLRVEQELDVNQSIAKTAQMLAHDLRRPFSMIEGILNMLSTPGDPAQQQAFATKYLPDVRRAIAEVTDMLSDVIEIGASDRLELSLVSPRSMVGDAVLEGLRYHPESDLSFCYEFNHRYLVKVDRRKMSRVMSNLVANAFQAMNFSGETRFVTDDLDKDGKLFTRCVIGNSGSVVAPEDQEKIFEAYFTKGKKAGTGLGLAIAQKVVREHGGDIWCVSNKEIGTEFHFLLPRGEEVDTTEVELLESSAEFRRQRARTLLQEDYSSPRHAQESDLERNLVVLLKELPRKLTIAIADDEAIYRNMLQEQLDSVAEVAERVEVALVVSGEDMLSLAKVRSFDVMVMDVDFGERFIDGFEAVRRLREQDVESTIVMHSNRGALKYQALSAEAGADLFVPKPLSRAVFYKILSSVAQNLLVTGCD